MKTVTDWWRAESAMILALAVALVVFIPGTWGKVGAAVLSVLGGGAVRRTVYSPVTVEAMRSGPPPGD